MWDAYGKPVTRRRMRGHTFDGYISLTTYGQLRAGSTQAHPRGSIVEPQKRTRRLPHCLARQRLKHVKDPQLCITRVYDIL